ncbi:hypothetical protein CGRA01v4_10800 [Colletotrichum graminicola]|nr:hypothetical protein CGRA01v4_10800 [Colletotrichum graminicola]
MIGGLSFKQMQSAMEISGEIGAV